MICPLHWPDPFACDESCRDIRREFRQAIEALRIYWKERGAGVPRYSVERARQAARSRQGWRGRFV